MPPFDNVLEDLVSITDQIANTEFRKRNADVTNYLSHLPTRQALMRLADAKECNMFAVSSGEQQTRFHATLMQELRSIQQATTRPDAERLLSLAHAINKISNIASIDERIAELKQKHEEYQVNIDYLKSTYIDNEKVLASYSQQQINMDTDLTKSMEEIESDVQQQLVRMNTIENQTRSKKDKLEMLKQQIAEKQAQLEQMEQSHSDEQQSQSKKLASLKRMIHTKKTLLTASAEPIPSTPRSESSQTIFEALQVKMDQLRSISLPKKQSHASNAMMDALELIMQSLEHMHEQNQQTNKLSHVWNTMETLRRQLVAVASEDQEKETALVAQLILELDQQDQLPLDDLKAKMAKHACDLGLDEAAGLQAIYGCMGKGILSIDRSQDDSFVQSNWTSKPKQ